MKADSNIILKQLQSKSNKLAIINKAISFFPGKHAFCLKAYFDSKLK